MVSPVVTNMGDRGGGFMAMGPSLITTSRADSGRGLLGSATADGGK